MSLRACAACVALCLLCALAASADEAPPRAKPGPLDADIDLARSGCAAVLSTLGIMLRNPPAEMARRMVQVPNEPKPRLYTTTEAFVDDSMRALCGSLALAQYRIVDGLLGERTWVEDPVPDYSPTPKPVSPQLSKLCRRMVKRHRRTIVSAAASGDLYAEACDALVGTPSPASVGERLRHAAHTLRANPAALWRLLPFLIVALALPFVCAPLVMGMPKVPEPRGPLEPGDADFVAGYTDEGESVGCVPPAVASSRKPTRGKPLQLKPKKT